MSNREKMYKTNSKAKAWLVEEGFTEIHFFPHTRFSKDAFFQGLGWDGLATLGHRLALFQTKTNCACTKKTRQRMKTASDNSGIILLWINYKTKKKQKELEIIFTSDDRDDLIKYMEEKK